MSLLERFSQANPPEGIYVSSPGGEFRFFSIVGPAIERRGLITFGDDVRSAAVILYCLGHLRLAFEDSTFFFHEVRALVGLSGEVKICHVEQVLEEQERMQADHREFYEEWRHQMRAAQHWFISFMSRTVGIESSTLLNLMRAEATLTARDAERYGIVHQVLPEGLREHLEHGQLITLSTA